jgi:hypothetical protein
LSSVKIEWEFFTIKRYIYKYNVTNLQFKFNFSLRGIGHYTSISKINRKIEWEFFTIKRYIFVVWKKIVFCLLEWLISISFTKLMLVKKLWN